jgi:hypothetical protein
VSGRKRRGEWLPAAYKIWKGDEWPPLKYGRKVFGRGMVIGRLKAMKNKDWPPLSKGRVVIGRL